MRGIGRLRRRRAANAGKELSNFVFELFEASTFLREDYESKGMEMPGDDLEEEWRDWLVDAIGSFKDLLKINPAVGGVLDRLPSLKRSGTEAFRWASEALEEMLLGIERFDPTLGRRSPRFFNDVQEAIELLLEHYDWIAIHPPVDA